MTARRIAEVDPCWEYAKIVGTFTYPDLVAATGRTYNTVVRKVRDWELAGAVAIERIHGTRRVTVRVINTEAQRPSLAPKPVPRADTSEQNMWTAIRMMTTFSPVDIAAHATTLALPVDIGMVREYCRALSHIGYLRTLPHMRIGTSQTLDGFFAARLTRAN